MEIYYFFILPVLAFVVVGAFFNPAIGVYYLIIDSLIIGHLASIDAINLYGFSIAKIIVIISFSSLSLHTVLGTYKINHKIFITRTAVLLYIFIGYLLWSSNYLMGRNDIDLINNLVLFILLIAVVNNKANQRLKAVMRIIIIAAIGIITVSSILRLYEAGTFLADVSNGGRIQPGFNVLLSFPFILTAIIYSDNTKQKTIFKLLLVVIVCFVLAQLSRTLAASLLVIIATYILRGYMKPITSLLLISIMFTIIAAGISTEYGRTLLRIPVNTQGDIKYNSNDLGAFTSGRSAIYPMAWQAFLKNPLVGAGYDSFRRPKGYIVDNNRERGALHSAWLQILSETGLIGAILYLCLYISCYFDFRKSRQSWTVNSFQFRLHEAIIMCLFIFFLGGIFDNFGYDYRSLYLFIALSSVLSTFATKNNFHKKIN